MTVAQLNKMVVKEIKDTFYKNCNPNQMTDRDLLLLILEPLLRKQSVSQVADEMLSRGLSFLASLSEMEISLLFRLNDQQSFHLMAVFELARRLNMPKLDEKIKIRCPDDVAALCQDMWNLQVEHFVLLYLNTKNDIIGRETISIGSLNASIVHPREVFKGAIRRAAASIIAVHNHPSGEPTPSPEDVNITKRLEEVGRLVGIELLDHIIIGDHRHISMKSQGLI